MSATAAQIAAPEQTDEAPEKSDSSPAGADDAIDISDEPTVLAEEDTLAPALSQGEREQEAVALSQKEREQMVRTLLASPWMPPALKERLAALVNSSAEAAADGAPRLKVAQVIEAIDETLPDFVQLKSRAARRAEHPAGDAFFRADAQGELTDADAESIAHAQLSRSGLLRGQRARAG